MAQDQQQYILEVPHEKALAIAEDIMSFSETDICLSGVKTCYIQPRSDWFENQMVNVLRNKTKMFQELSEIDDQIVKIAM